MRDDERRIFNLIFKAITPEGSTFKYSQVKDVHGIEVTVDSTHLLTLYKKQNQSYCVFTQNCLGQGDSVNTLKHKIDVHLLNQIVQLTNAALISRKLGEQPGDAAIYDQLMKEREQMMYEARVRAVETTRRNGKVPKGSENAEYANFSYGKGLGE